MTLENAAGDAGEVGRGGGKQAGKSLMYGKDVDATFKPVPQIDSFTSSNRVVRAFCALEELPSRCSFVQDAPTNALSIVRIPDGWDNQNKARADHLKFDFGYRVRTKPKWNLRLWDLLPLLPPSPIQTFPPWMHARNLLSEHQNLRWAKEKEKESYQCILVSQIYWLPRCQQATPKPIEKGWKTPSCLKTGWGTLTTGRERGNPSGRDDASGHPTSPHHTIFISPTS